MARIIIIILTFLMLVGCSSKHRAQDSYSIAIVGSAPVLDIQKAATIIDFSVVDSLYDTIVRMGETGSIEPGLAHKWKISEDGLNYTFYIDPNAKFSDGTKITNNIVANSIAKKCLKSSSGLSFYTAFAIKTDPKTGLCIVSTGDNSSFTISLAKPYTAFLSLLSHPYFSIGNMIKKYSGAYSLKGDDSKNITLLKNPHYLGNKNVAKKLYFYTFKSVEALKNSPLYKKLDLIFGVPFGNAKKTMFGNTFKMQASRSFAYLHFIGNQSRDFTKFSKYKAVIGKTLQSFTNKHDSCCLSPTKLFTPPGLLPPQYYVESKATPFTNLDQVKLKSSLKIIISRNHLPNTYIKKVQGLIDKLGKKANLEVLEGRDYLKKLFSGDYDYASLPYISNIPDIDGLIFPLRKGFIPGVHVFTKKLDAEFLAASSLPESEKLKIYASTIRKIESNWDIIPLHVLKIPIFYSSRVKVPSLDFRYFRNIWQLERLNDD